MAASASPRPPVADAASHAWRRIGTGAAAMIAGRVVTAACGLVQVRIVASHIGPAGLGLWITLTGLLWSATILDGGIGFALQNRVTTLLANGNEVQVTVLIRRTARQLWFIGAGIVVLGLPAAFLGAWSRWFGVTDRLLIAQLPYALGVVVLAGGLLVPNSVASKVLAARQLLWITGTWTTVASVLGLVATFVAANLGGSLVGFIAASCILPLLPPIASWFHIRTAPSAPAGLAADPEPLWREGSLFLLPQLGAAVISTLSPTLITVFAGPIAAAAFGVLQRLYGFALQVHNMGLSPTWPSYAHAAATGDVALARRTYRTTWWATIGLFITPTLIVTWWVPDVVRVWLGEAAPTVPALLLWMTAVWYIMQYCGQTIAVVLNGVGRVRQLATVSWIGLPIALALSALLGPRWGATGVVTALLIPYVLLNLPATAWYAWRGLQGIGRTFPHR